MADSYRNSLEESKVTLRALIAKRNETNVDIERLQAVITALANMLNDPEEKMAELVELGDIVGPTGLTDAVLSAVGSSLKGLTAIQVRDYLAADRFDLSRYSNALAAIHTTLKRLKAAEKISAKPDITGETVYLAEGFEIPKVRSWGMGKRRR